MRPWLLAMLALGCDPSVRSTDAQALQIEVPNEAHALLGEGARMPCTPGWEYLQPDLEAVGSPGRIAVQHRGLWSACDASWTLFGTVEGDTLTVDYQQDGGDPTCTCKITLDYGIVDLDPGPWLLRAGPDRTEATVQVPVD